MHVRCGRTRRGGRRLTWARTVRLIACDRDPVARTYFDGLKDSWRCSSRFYPGDFADTLHQLNRTGFRATHVYMDLGVSSMQVDTIDRGFSYSYDAPLDMRMDPTLTLTAADILNEWPEDRLVRVFREYGEERYARSIARAVVRRRQRAAYARTHELVDTIKEAIPTPARFGSRNPARRVFQALRIAVNDELESLRRALPEALELLRTRWRAGRHQLPLARGPHRQGLLHGRACVRAVARRTSPCASACASRPWSWSPRRR